MVAAGALEATKFREERLRKAAEDPALLATEAADHLVRKGVPFREAHDLGRKTSSAKPKHRVFLGLNLIPSDARSISPLFDQDFFNNPPSLESAISFKAVPGGTAVDSVRTGNCAIRAKVAKAGD